MAKLTKKVVDATAADQAGRDRFLWDAEVKGFGLKIAPSGSKTYVLQYRTAEAKSRRYTIGKHGSPWTCEEARTKSVALLRDLAAGNDPLDAKASAKTFTTVAVTLPPGLPSF